MSDTFASTVHSITANFDVLYNEGRSRRSSGMVSVRTLPWGGGVVIQSAGPSPITRAFRLFVASESDMQDLEGCRGDHGTLTITEGTYDCTLTEIDGTLRYTDGSQEVSATFIMDSL